MGRMKVGIALAGAVLALLGVVVVITVQGGGGLDPAVSVAGQEPVTGAPAPDPAPPPVVTTAAPATTVPGTPAAGARAPSPTPTTRAPGTNAAPTAVLPAQPTAQDIQKVIEGVTTQVLSANTTASTKPLTKEEVEAQVLEQLKRLGIVL